MSIIVTWNINSIRQRINHLLRFINVYNPEIILLQETKTTNENFPTAELEDKGYNIAIHGQKSFNGVAILSKYPLEDISTSFTGNENDSQCRYIEAVANTPNSILRIASVYVPNGQTVGSEKFAYKMQFMQKLHNHLDKLLYYEEPIIIGGDYNIAPEANDVHDPNKWHNKICFHPEERSKIRAIRNLGYYDSYRIINPQKKQFSWWDYRGGAFSKDYGLRIDYLLLSPQAADMLVASDIDITTRSWDKPSDHAAVWCKLSIISP